MLSVDFDPSLIRLNAELLAISAGIDELRKPLRQIVEGIISPSIKHNFQVGGRPKWPPLSEETLRQKAALGSPTVNDPLRRFGTLMEVASAVEGTWEFTDDTAMMTSLPGAQYGGVHQFGYPAGSIPERPFAVIQPQDEEEMEQAMSSWIYQNFAQHGWAGNAMLGGSIWEGDYSFGGSRSLAAR